MICYDLDTQWSAIELPRSRFKDLHGDNSMMRNARGNPATPFPSLVFQQFQHEPEELFQYTITSTVPYDDPTLLFANAGMNQVTFNLIERDILA